MSAIHTSFHGLDRDALVRVVEPIVRAHGAEVVDVELKSERGGWVLRVYVEKLGAAEKNLSTEQAGVDLSLCADVAHELSPALDAVDLIPHSYSLEVSSPGVERALRGERDFVRFAGQKAKLKLARAVRGQMVVVGLLGPVANGAVTVDDGGRTYEIPLADVESARLVFEFGPASRPSPSSHKKKHKKH
jgi:ribosome maturation factor RimP